MKRRVVITGMGAVSPLGNCMEEVWEKIKAGKSGITKLDRFDPASWKANHKFPRIAGQVQNFSPSLMRIEKRRWKNLDLASQFAVVAAQQAEADAGLCFKQQEQLKAGVIVGNIFGGSPSIWEESDILYNPQKGAERISPFLTSKMIGSSPAGHVGIVLEIKGVTFSINSACASGATSVGEGYRKIQSGELDVCVTGGSDACLTPLVLASFGAMQACSIRTEEPEKASRPFDHDRDGFVPSEGAAIMVIEELGHALARKAKIYVEIVGYGATADAFHITMPDVNGLLSCMKTTLEDAQLDPGQIDYINAHGTSTQIGDINESQAIIKLFQSCNGKLMVSSTKSMTGHMMAATGAIEIMFTALALRDGIIPPTINLDNQDIECDLADCVPHQARTRKITYALSNSYGFGGKNACLALKKFE